MWVPATHLAFPNHHRLPRLRTELEHRVAKVHFLRNGVAHHEPIHRRNLRQDYDDIRAVMGWICTDTQAWMVRCSRFETVLVQRPA
jgi:hypothetical protein